MPIRVDNRGYMRATIALRKAFDAAIERRRAGAGIEEALSEELISLMRDVLGDGGWTAFLTKTIASTGPDGADEDLIDDVHDLLARIRTVVREQGLIGWILVMDAEAEEALDSQQPSDLMLDSWAPDAASDPHLSEERRQEIADDALYDDMERFENDARRIGATLLLRWADDDRAAVRIAGKLLSGERDLAAVSELAGGLLATGSIDDPATVAWLKDRAEEYVTFDGLTPRIEAIAKEALARREDDPLWHLLNGVVVDDADIDGIHAAGDKRLSRLMGGLPAACVDPIVDNGADGDAGERPEDAGFGPDAPRRYRQQEVAWIYDVYRTVRGLADLWGLPDEIDRAYDDGDSADADKDDDAAFAARMERHGRQAAAIRDRFLAKRHPGREDDPWLDQGWLGYQTGDAIGEFLVGPDLQDGYALVDEEAFAAQATVLSFMVHVTRCVGLLRMPGVFVTSTRELAMGHAEGDPDAAEEQVHWEQLACADLAGVLLRRIPDASVARALALELLRGDMGRYAVAVDAVYAGGAD